ncbi:MAG: biopolymer transporter ExbD [Rhodobacteraceae bacterium]|nr:biopolymer transporter ExbD [Paracoccaceae bacterium]
MIALPAAPRRRRLGLAPMIDVVFLLLIFFMLVARFGAEATLPLAAPGGAGDWTGPPRLVGFAPGGALRLNGGAVAPEALADALAPLMDAPDDPVILRPESGASLQDMADLTDRLAGAGITNLILLPEAGAAP